MKDRTVQWVSPNYVKTSLIQSLLLSLIILIILGVSLYMRIVLSAIAFAVTLLFQWISLPNAFKSVAIDEKGIRCGKTVIEWHQVKNISVFMAYADLGRSIQKVDEAICGKRMEYPVGTMIAINAETAQNIWDFGKGIYISRTAKADRILKKYCRLYREYTEEHTRSKMSDFQKGEKNLYFWGNPRLFAKLFLINFFTVAMVTFFLLVMLGQLELWKAISIGVLFFLLFMGAMSRAYRDAFRLIKVNEHGIFFDGMMVPWDQISHTWEAEAEISIGFCRVDCGKVIAVNTEVGDRYLGRHVYDGVYFCKTQKTMGLFQKYMKDE